MNRLIIVVAAVAATMALTLAPASAQEDLDCGDPGTYPDMPVEPGDPHDLDADDDGIGCEANGGDGGGAPAPAPEPAPAEPADPQVRQPTYTG